MDIFQNEKKYGNWFAEAECNIRPQVTDSTVLSTAFVQCWVCQLASPDDVCLLRSQLGAGDM